MNWTHRVTTAAGGGFWCYATSLDQGLKIANGDPTRVQPLDKAPTPVLPVKLPVRRLVEAVESEPVDAWAAGRPSAPVVPTFPPQAEA